MPGTTGSTSDAKSFYLPIRNALKHFSPLGQQLTWSPQNKDTSWIQFRYEEEKTILILPEGEQEPGKEKKQEPRFQSYCSMKLEQPQREAGTRRDLDEEEKCDATQGGAQAGVWVAWSDGETTDSKSRD